MPLDPMMADAMIGAYRPMLQEVKDKGLQNEHVDKMQACMDRMEALVQEKDDMNEFNAAMMAENLSMDFSMAYGAALSAEASVAQEEKGYDDAGLLKQSLDALRDAVKRLKEGREAAITEAGRAPTEEEKTLQKSLVGSEMGKLKGGVMFTLHKKKLQRQANAQVDANQGNADMKKPLEDSTDTAELIEPIEELIAFGESCTNFPTFLREQIVRGLDKAIEGQGVAKKHIEKELAWARRDYNPVMIEMREKLLEAFEALEKKAPFGVPDSFEYSLERRRIEHKYAPALAEWDQITDHWERVIDEPLDWLEAHCSFAPNDDRWKDSGGSMERTMRNIKRTKLCGPYYLAKREEILKRFCGLTWDTFWAHPTYQWAWEKVSVSFSPERIELIKKVYPLCQPGAVAPDDLIKEAEALREQKKDYRYDEMDRVVKEAEERYDEQFGEGAFQRANS